MGHTHGHSPRATLASAIVGREGHPVDPAVAFARLLRPQQDRGPLKHRIRACVPIAEAIDRLILHILSMDVHLVLVGGPRVHEGVQGFETLSLGVADLEVHAERAPSLVFGESIL